MRAAAEKAEQGHDGGAAFRLCCAGSVDRAARRWQSNGEMARSTAPVNPPRGQTPRLPVLRGRALRAALLATTLALGGCALFGAPDEPRGNRVDADVLREITPGVQTKADVTALLGSPSATGTFDPNEWYYISATSHIRPGRVPGIEKQRVVVVSFNQQGVVQGIRELGEEDGRNIRTVERTTPVPGNDRSLLQALFGNIGRFGAGGISTPTGPGQSAPPP
jgi:outer membrane protein assembly factor BamE (lipoprotein component of BamABCDE complex)